MTKAAFFLGAAFFFVLFAAPSQAGRVVRPAPDQPTGTTASIEQEGWFPFPFVHWTRETDGGTMRGVHPFYTFWKDDAGEEWRSAILWPLVDSFYKPETKIWKERRVTTVFPIWFSGSGIKDGKPQWDRFLIPFYWQGEREGAGKYFILFPFIWHARDALLPMPLFPNRPQNITALWPLFGHFEGYFNRESIRFYLWPLFVRSIDEEDDGGRRVVQTSFPWPFLSSIWGEEGIWGFRIWPLFAYVENPGYFERAYWLWPLGRYENELQHPDGSPHKLILFLPFYGKVRQPKVQFDLVFPFYGELRMKGRHARGYMLSMYSIDDNLRKGVRKHTLLWFLIRWRERIPIPPELQREEGGSSFMGGGEKDEPQMGGGFFPFYIRRYNNTSEYTAIVWPIFRKKLDRIPGGTFKRTYFTPIYSNQTTTYNDQEGIKRRLFFFPFYRERIDPDGSVFRNAPHLFPHTDVEPVDRNWSPVWSFWRQTIDGETGKRETRFLGPVWQADEDWLGVERKKLDLFVFSHETYRGTVRPKENHTRLLWGLLGHHRLGGERQWELFGKRL